MQAALGQGAGRSAESQNTLGKAESLSAGGEDTGSPRPAGERRARPWSSVGREGMRAAKGKARQRAGAGGDSS